VFGDERVDCVEAHEQAERLKSPTSWITGIVRSGLGLFLLVMVDGGLA
jgi:hypothetical protein